MADCDPATYNSTQMLGFPEANSGLVDDARAVDPGAKGP